MKHIRLSQISSVPRSSTPAGFASRHAGFTLTELIVTVAILAVVTTFAIPEMQTLVVNNRVSTLANEFTSGLSYTRGEAVNRNMCVTMCITANPNAENPTCAPNLNDWNNGWIILANPYCDDGLPLKDKHELLQVYEGFPSGPQLSSAGATVRRITFTARGVPSAIATAREFTLNTGGTSMKPVKTICLDAAGRARVGDYNSPLC